MSAASTIAVHDSPISFPADPGRPVLDSALEAGVRLPHNCRGGVCGTCKATVLEGGLDDGGAVRLALTDDERLAGVRLLCQARPVSAAVRVRVHAPLPAQPGAPMAPKEVPCEVVAARPVTPTVREVALAVPKAARLRYRAGMHMEFAVPGLEPARTYSMLDAPGDGGGPPGGVLRFLVARKPGRGASAWIHERLRPGDVLGARGPFGTFALPDGFGGPVLGLAGGTGVSPVLAVLEEALAGGLDRPAMLVLSVRNRDEVLCMDAFARLAATHPNFSYKITLTREAPPVGTRYLAGRAPDLLHRLHGSLEAHAVLAAGAPGFVDACAARARGLGAPPDRIALDSFLPAAAPA